MKLLYVVRRDKQYHEQGVISDYFLNDWKVKGVIDAWNDTFNIKWLQFRWLLNDLRDRNAQDLKWDDKCYFYELPSIDLTNYIVIPTDDDDWFHPDLFTLLRELPLTDHYRWSYSEVIGNNYYKIPPSDSPSYTASKLTIYHKKNHPAFIPYYASNNYAVFAPKNLDIINNHGTADDVFSHKEPSIDKCLSIHHSHLCSISFLSFFQYKGVNLRKLLPNLLETYKQPCILPDDTPQYYFKYFEELTKIYKTLSPKRTFFI